MCSPSVESSRAGKALNLGGRQAKCSIRQSAADSIFRLSQNRARQTTHGLFSSCVSREKRTWFSGEPVWLTWSGSVPIHWIICRKASMQRLANWSWKEDFWIFSLSAQSPFFLRNVTETNYRYFVRTATFKCLLVLSLWFFIKCSSESANMTRKWRGLFDVETGDNVPFHHT